MATFKSFEDMEVWQKSRALMKEINALCDEGRFKNNYDLRSQLNRATRSIMLNIAEGFEREGNKEFRQFLYISKGSAGEVRSCLYEALDNNYIKENEFNLLKERCVEISRMLKGLISYIQSSEMKGFKFKTDKKKSNSPEGLQTSNPQTSN